MKNRLIKSTLLICGTLLPSLLFAEMNEKNAARSDTTEQNANQRAIENNNDRARDNSGLNSRDMRGSLRTADEQGMSDKATEITRDIRKQIIARDDFSIYARNVKIITGNDGKVTLRGPVRSEDERMAIGLIATDVAGQNQVLNQLEIAKDN